MKATITPPVRREVTLTLDDTDAATLAYIANHELYLDAFTGDGRYGNIFCRMLDAFRQAGIMGRELPDA